MAWQNNSAALCGAVGGEPALSHTSRGVSYFSFPLLTSRLSGAVDRVNVLLPERLLTALPPEGRRLRIQGELRSFNNRGGEGSRLVLYIHAQELCPVPDTEADDNLVCLSGVLCKTPTWRRTPMGREITDLMLAVSRRYGRADYLPCIAWGRNAEEAAAWQQGRPVSLTGRFQSRKYIKLEAGVGVEKTAYEVSVTAFRPEETAL